MTTRHLDSRWVVAAAATFTLCVAALLTSAGLPPGATEAQVLSGVGWLAAIAGLFSVVRAGVDGGVHHTAQQRAHVR